MIHARCPGCRAHLTIPDAWVNQAIRCTRCGMPVQAKAPALEAAAVGRVTVPMGLIPSVAAINRLRAMPPLSVRLGHGAGTVITPPPRRRRPNRIVPVIGWALALGVLGAGGYVGFDMLRQQFPEPVEPEPVIPEPVPVKKKDGKTDGPAGKVDDKRDKRDKLPLTGPFPRRLLAIQISNYLYFNPVSYGPKARDGHVLVGRMARAMQVPAGQVFELSDAAPTPRPPLRDTVSAAIRDFAATSRGQDRIVLLFSGHAIDVEGIPYLVPVDGEPGNVASLVPLREVFEQLAACKARQKLLILDVCRFDPSRGSERPSGGAMTEAFEAALAKAPPGVQVWASCSAGQYSYDDAIVSGGVFMSALTDAVTAGGRPTRRLLLPAEKQDSPLPIKDITFAVNRWTIDDARTYVRRPQTPRLHGSEIKDGADFDPREPAAAAIAFPKVEGAFFAPKELVQSILREASRIPPVRVPAEGTQPLQADNFPGFRNSILRDYRDTESPLRDPIEAAVAVLVQHRDAFREEFAVRNIDQLKRDVVPIQGGLAQKKLALDEALEALEKAAADRQKEPAPRWRAVHDLVRARLLMRVAYVVEYQHVLAEIRTDALPDLGPTHIGWRLASREKMLAKGDLGKEAKERARKAREILETVAREHPRTPYEILAKRELATALGLEWQPLSPAGMTQE